MFDSLLLVLLTFVLGATAVFLTAVYTVRRHSVTPSSRSAEEVMDSSTLQGYQRESIAEVAQCLRAQIPVWHERATSVPEHEQRYYEAARLAAELANTLDSKRSRGARTSAHSTKSS